MLRQLYGDRRLLFELVARDVRSRYAGARFGLVWSLLNPVIQLVSYGAIFGYLYAPAGEPGGLPFVATLFCGLWPWWAFNEGVLRGLSALVDQAALLRRVPMPPQLCVVAAVAASYALNMVGLVLFLALFGLFGIIPASLSWLALPLAMLLGAVVTAGLALVLAPIQLVVRDTAYVVSALLTIGFFVSPVLYETQVLAGAIQTLTLLNPMTGLIGLYRWLILGHPVTAPWISLTLLTAATALFWVAAARVFARLEATLDEYL